MMQKIFKLHLEKHGTLDNIEDYYIFQMNDTHPVFGCLEFIRLLKQHGYSFEEASKKAKKCFAYTNHTIMSEALEKWPVNLFNDVLSGVFKVVQELNQELIDELLKKDEFYFDKDRKQVNWGAIRRYELMAEGCVHMARIACYVGCKINGVAAVHTGIVQRETLAKWYKLYPEKFVNVTNGVTPRRWVLLSNPDLSKFLDKYVGKGWAVQMDMLEKLEQYKNDPVVLAEFAAVKHKAKDKLGSFIHLCEDVLVDTDSMFEAQVKRIHEYKRQVMTALCILYIYDQLKAGNLPNFHKTTFIIGGKAAASYEMAKHTITLLKDIQEMVSNDPEVNDKLKVVFLTNFSVSYGEKVYAGADLSVQISTAGKEASGTGNMKFMMNGAPTIGTLDGANIEIVEEAGSKNNYIFGATVEELNRIKPIYNHKMFLDANGDLVALLSYLKGDKNLKRTYWDIVNMLLYNDMYFVMYDLRSYIETTLRANSDYAAEKETGDLSCWTRKCLKNTAHSGKFSSDRSIKDYAEKIWHIEKV